MRYFLKLFTILTFFIVSNSYSVYAIDSWTWSVTAPNNVWSNYLNWNKNGFAATPGQLPVAGDNITISRSSGSITVTVPNAFAMASLTTAYVKLNMTGTNTVSGAFVIGTGTELSGGTVNITTSTTCSIATALDIGTTLTFNTSAVLTISLSYPSTFNSPLTITSTYTGSNGVVISGGTYSTSATVILTCASTTVVAINSLSDPTHPTTFNGTFTSNLNNFDFDHCIFNGTTNISKPSGYNISVFDTRNHDNVFNGTTTITNGSIVELYFGTNDTYNGNTTFTRSGGGDLFIGSSSGTNSVTFKQNVIFNNTNASGNMYIARYANNTVNFSPTTAGLFGVTFNNPNGTNIYVGKEGKVNFNKVGIQLVSSGSATAGILFGETVSFPLPPSSPTSPIDLLTVYPTSATRLVSFTSDCVFNMSMFTSGILSFHSCNFANSPNLTLNPASTTGFSNTLRLKPGVICTGSLTVQFKNIEITGGQYAAATITKYSAVPVSGSYPADATVLDNAMTGQLVVSTITYNYPIIFSGDVAIINNSVKNLYFGIAANIYDKFSYGGNVTITRNNTASNTGDVQTSMGGMSFYIGNYSYSGLDFGTVMAGNSVFIGTTALNDDKSVISRNGATVNNIRFGSLEMSQVGSNRLVLSSPVYIGAVSGATFKLTKGNIVSSATYLLTIRNGIVQSGGSLNSFIEGPEQKEGNELFVFHVGKPSIYMPIKISAPSTATMALTAEFLNSNAPGSIAHPINSPLRDYQRCQYWTLNNSGTGTPAVTLSLSYNNAAGQSCYKVNPSVVGIAYFNASSSPSWNNVTSTPDASTVIPGVSTVTSSANIVTTFGSFALGYMNALVIDTRQVNNTTFTVANGIEPLTVTTFYSGATSTINPTQTFTGLGYINNSPGVLVLHPNAGATIDVAIQTDDRTDPLNLKIFMEASVATLPAVNKVQGQEDGVYNDMSTEFYTRTGNFVTFYKDKQDPAYYTSLTNNLTDGVTFYASRYSPNLATFFQISGVPAGFTPTMTIAPIGGSVIVTNSTLVWDGRISNVYVAEGVYEYNLQLVNTSPAQTYTYRGQFSLKYK